MKRTVLAAVAATLLGSAAMADPATDQIIADLQAQGFERIEIDTGIGQIKVEAIRGTQKLEVIYDRATGSILKQETERVRVGENTAPGVSIRNRDRDFVDVSRSSGGTGVSGSAPVVSTSGGSTDQIVSDLQAQGFTRIEVKTGISQTKVEAIRGTEKIEVVFDRATGEVIKQETETVRAGEDTRPGVSIRERDRDFVGGSGSSSSRSDDDDDDDHGGRSSDDDNDDDDRSGKGSGNSGSGKSGSDDDDHDDDRGGHGDDDDDDDSDDDDDDSDDDDDDSDDD